MEEATKLSPSQELAFQAWVKANKITDVDHPDSHYDYRGYFKEFGGKPVKFGTDHFPDTYKQHGHPTFSQESKYSFGPRDGGMWLGEQFLAQPQMAVSHPIDKGLLEELLKRSMLQR